MKKTILISIMSLVFAVCANAQQTYRNPVINADAPDVSVCKVADTYYMISTTMHLMPGGPIMKSKDMVNWEIASYVFDRIDDGDRYNLIGGQTVYGQGQWASSIRYHMGKFWVWFTANGAPGKGFIFSADSAEGPWTLVARPPHMHDASLFFDEDGKKYLFTGSASCTVVELDDNFNPKEGGLNVKVVNGADDPQERGALLEGSSVIKHNGYYYICMISMKWGAKGRVRREVCYRSRNIAGPYEKKIILETPFETYGGVGQGCLVGDDQSDKNWWALIFQDRGGIGRVPCAMPVTWVEDWPMCGEYTGEINNEIADIKEDNPSDNPRLDRRRYKIPNDLSKKHPSVKGFIGSDEFDFPTELLNKMMKPTYHARTGLKLYWQWNHNPIDEAWSLTERPGFMRLKTARVVDNLNVAPNTLTQRMSGPLCTGSVCMDISKMQDGDICGLAAYNGDSGVLRIVKKGGKTVLQLTEEKSVFARPRNIERVDVEVIEEVPLKAKTVYLKLHGDFNANRDMASFSYSLDGNNWKSIGHEIPMRFDYTRHFMGSKFAIFNYATKKTGGYVDVDWFRFVEE
ncbi:MAG: glycoside hydrolase 43 family protein [Prevotellaceae bacterium]|nr:glycoside hydrolase 43 family protein [Candidatus Minthosoma caballi]